MTTVGFGGAIPVPSKCKDRDETEKVFRDEFRISDGWTQNCTLALQTCPSLLFEYDRMENACAKAFGTEKYKILLNPLMMVCYHKSCVSAKKVPIVRLKHVLDISTYLLHLAGHTDEVGQSMLWRFRALKKDVFLEKYDEIANSPYRLLNPPPLLTDATTAFMKKYGIIRNLLKMNYLCWWKNKMIEEGFVTSQSLTYQEDDARISMLLSYPYPVSSWFTWKTLCLFAMKSYTSVSGTAVNVFRGLTNYPSSLKNKCVEDRLKFIELVNHPCPSITKLQEWLPAVSLANEQYHDYFQQVHIRVLSKIAGSLVLQYKKVLRYPVVLGIDEQELNQGTFIENGILHGLLKKKTVRELREIGLKNLAKYIATECHFLSSVREYRLTDFLGILCSNIFTQFISGVLDTDKCIKSLEDVIKLANMCMNCVDAGYECSYVSLKEQCSECLSRGIDCESLVVLHISWDMGSSHVKTEKTVPKITILSTNEEFCNPKLQTFAFGGLHLSKAIINCIRNHSLSLDGHNYGLHVLRALKNQDGPHSSTLDMVKCSVLVGKDRQSDLSSYLTSSSLVQDALKAAGVYSCTRLPEPVLTYTDNARKQKKIIMPIGIQCNLNGDVFILDCGATCIHVADRSSVIKYFLVGNYMLHSTVPYKEGSSMKGAGELRLSNMVSDIFISPKDDVFVVDPGRQEIAILRQCTVASKVSSATFNILRKPSVRSVCGFGDSLACLSVDLVEIINLTLPPVSKKAPLDVPYQVKKKISLEEPVKKVFSVFSGVLGVLSDDQEIIFYSNIKQKQHDKRKSGLRSIVKPLCQGNNCVLLQPQSKKLEHVEISIGKDNALSISSPLQLDFDVGLHCSAVAKWGQTYYTTSNVNGSMKLMEYGQLVLGSKLSECVCSFYDAICYTVPNDNQSSQIRTLEESIEQATPLVNLTQSIQAECEARFPRLSTFRGAYGAVFTPTANCLQSTVQSAKALHKRMEFLDPECTAKINPHVILNESLIEHTFGFTKSQGRSDLQNQYEYLHNKSKHEIDFLLKLTKLPFCQYVKTKLRDKSYQHVDENTLKSPVTAEDLWDMLFHKSKSSDKTAKTPIIVHSQADDAFLRKCFLYTKSVARKSNRAKWKENSGYAPNLLDEQQESAKLLKGDLVFCKDQFGSVKQLFVDK